jgi:hypothetical protein
MHLSMTGAAAQVVVTPVGNGPVTTDTVDLFGAAKGDSRSSRGAMIASLVLPGTGHQYFGKNRSALAFFSAEAASIFAFIFCDQYAEKLARNAAGYASVHSGAQGPISDADDYYWKLVGSFMDTREHNHVMELNRTPEKMIVDENRVWHWDDQSSQDRYNDIRSASRSYRIVSAFFLGALVFNRVAAFITIRSATSGGALLDLRPSVSVTPSSIDCSVAGSF